MMKKLSSLPTFLALLILLLGSSACFDVSTSGGITAQQEEPIQVTMVESNATDRPTPTTRQPGPAGNLPPIRTISWNIEWFPGRSLDSTDEAKAQHLREVTAFLPELKADILLLQEIGDRDATREILAYDPEMKIDVMSRFLHRGNPGLQQLVIASRYRAIASFTEEFLEVDEPGIRLPRGFVFAALEVAPSKMILVYNVHLKSNLGNPAINKRIREESAKQILQHAKQMMEEYKRYQLAVVVGGDLNLLLHQEAMADEKTLDILTEGGFHWTWEGVPFEKRVTWPARGRYGDASFDHFLTKNLGPLKAEILDHPDLSDHRPVLITIDPNQIR